MTSNYLSFLFITKLYAFCGLPVGVGGSIQNINCPTRVVIMMQTWPNSRVHRRVCGYI